MDDRRRRDVARKLEVGTSVAAGGVGSSLGAAKLRDAYAEEHPASFARGEQRVARAASPKVARFLGHAKPGFKPLAAGTGTAIIATAASKYRQSKDHKLARQGVAKAKRDEQLVDRVDETDATARKLRAKVIPSKIQLAERLNQATTRIKNQVQQDLQKAYDPQRGRRRRARALEVASGAGATTAAVGAVRDRREAGRVFERSRVNERDAAQAFGHARRKGGRVAEDLASFASPRGKPRTVSNLGATFETHQREHRELNHGMTRYAQAFHEGREGHRLVRRANKSALAAAGLTAVAVGARRAVKHNQG